jgi:hypothetical protein
MLIMNWGVLTSVFLLGTFKFMFAAIPGAVLDIPFWQTYLALITGGIVSAGFFFFTAGYFMERNRIKRIRKNEKALNKGKKQKEIKKFTRVNKLVVKIKRSIGIYGISLYAPLFLSIPIGAIVVAKFYNKKFITFPLIMIGIMMNGAIITLISYIFK